MAMRLITVTFFKPNMRCIAKYFAVLLFFSFAGGIGSAMESGSVNPVRLRCEYRVDPLGIDALQPRLNWILEPTNPSARGLAQSGYRVLVSSSPKLLDGDQGDLWDSGKVGTDQMNQVAYAGRPLASHQQVWWKVKVWDQSGLPSAWSSAAQWTMGILQAEDWGGAKWIAAPDAHQPIDSKGPKPAYETVLLRREFTVQPNLKRALVQVCGLGQYELTFNGGKIGDELLSPGWTLYRKTCLYNTYDITSALWPGANVAGLFLGNSFFNGHGGRYTCGDILFRPSLIIPSSVGPVQAIALLRLEYADGTVTNIITDEKWKTASGPITFSSIYGGEDFDARLVQEGWEKPGFQDTNWTTPAITAGPGGVLKGLSAAAPPIRSFEILTPVSTKVIGAGVTVYDLGQNASLMLRLKVKGPAGASVRITPSELVKSNGDINDTMCRGQSYWTYTLSGKGDEHDDSHFYYRGGRYLKVELQPAAAGQELPVIEAIEGVTLHADAPVVGQFSCSNERFNKIHTLIRWAQKNNMVSVMTDCPTREKQGWLEEDHLNGPALRYNFDLATLMTKMAGDMADSQRASGLVPSTCPDYRRAPDNNKYTNPPEWGSACILVPWQQYQFDGDLELLRRSYDMMKKYVSFLTANSKDNLLNFGLGDWYDNQGFSSPKLTPIALTATAFYYEDARKLSQIATLLGKPDDAARYQQLATTILTSFNRTFFHAATNSYSTGSQASLAVPLALDMVAPSARAAVLDNLVKDFQAKQTTVGEVCLELLITALAEAGRSDLIFSTYNSSQSGYGLQVKLGKTSLTEGWNGGSSQDHFMFGQLDEWFFRHLAGIQDDPAAPGFKKIIIRPAVVGDLNWVKASYASIQGTIVSEWQRIGTNLTLHVIIPPNTTAKIYVPAASATQVTESGVPATRARGVKLVAAEAGAAIFEVGSGDFNFVSH